MADKPRRGRIYLLDERGEDGAVNQVYVRQEGDGHSDQGYWIGTPYISGRQTTVGAQGQHIVIYDVIMDENTPLTNSDDAVIAILGAADAEVQYLKVHSVGLLTSTAEKICRTEDVSDENWADRLTV